MTNMTLFPFVLAFAGLTSVFYSLTVFGQKGKWDRPATFTFWTAVAFIAPILAYQVYEKGESALLGGGGIAAFLGFAVAIIYLVMEKRFDNRSFGIIVAPLVFLAICFSFFHKQGLASLPPELKSPLFFIHVPMFILGYGFFVLAFVSAVFYLIQERMLKTKKTTSWLRRFPPLEAVDDLCYTMVSIGFPLITLGMFSGAMWSYLAWHRIWSLEQKEMTSLITWIVFAIYLHGRYLRGWRGRKTNLILILGFIMIIVTFHGLGLMQNARHTFIK